MENSCKELIEDLFHCWLLAVETVKLEFMKIQVLASNGSQFKKYFQISAKYNHKSDRYSIALTLVSFQSELEKMTKKPFH